MQSSPLNGVFDFLIMALGLGNQNSQSQQIIEIPAIILPPQYQAPPNLFPNGQDTFLPPLNPGGISVLPPFNPIGGQGSGSYNPNAGMPQNQNDIPDDIRELLG